MNRAIVWRRAALALAGLLAFAAASLPWWAAAAHREVVDGDDVRGLLDIKLVDVEGDQRPTWRIVTYHYWRNHRIFDRGYALVYFDTFGDSRMDHYALVRSDGYRLQAELYRDRRTKPDYIVGALDAWRPGRWSLSVRVPLHRLNIADDRTYYRWSARTLFTSDVCPRVCIDLAPDAGAVREPLVQPTPTPSVTPSAARAPAPSNP